MTTQPVVLNFVARTLYPAMLVASILIVVRGHNEPGGGFIGGMVAVAATAFRAAAAGRERALRAYPGGPLRLATTGAVLAFVSGLPALWLGQPFLTHYGSHLGAGAYSVTVSTVLLFDTGVYLVIWGALGAIAAEMIGLGEEHDA